MSLVVPALCFLAHYLLTMAVCGAAVWRLTIARETYLPEAVDERRRLAIAAFLIGTALAPFVIGLVQGLLWIALPQQKRWLYAVLQWGWLAVALIIARRSVNSCMHELVAAAWKTPTRRLGALALVIVLGFVSAHAAFHSLSPERHYDASTYALDARRLAEQRTWSALMTHEARDETNQFANHNHGSSYQSFLSAALIYKNPRQDFALRVAQRVLAIHVVVVLIGLGLRLGWGVGLLAPLLLLSYVFFGAMIASASRDFYRVLPLLFIVGMFRLGGRWPGFNPQGLLLAVGFTFLWNSHATSVMIAPMLLACMLVLSPRVSSILSLLIGFAISVPLGALRLVRSYLQTGDPLHDSPLHNLNYLDTPIVGPWFAARGTLPAGITHAFEKLARQFTADGPVAVLILWSSLVALLIWCAMNLKRRRWPGGPHGDPLLLLAGGYVLMTVLLLAGALDGVTDKLSATLAMNPRYRAHLYPLAAIVAGFFIWQLAPMWFRRRPARSLHLAIISLTAAALLLAAKTWEGHHMGLYPDTRKANTHLAQNEPYYRWAGLLRCLDPRELVLMDYAYLGWYQTDNTIMFTQDPRLRAAFTATDPAEVVRFLDSLGVRYVYLIDLERNAIFDSGVALAQALQSPAFEVVMIESPKRDKKDWYLYRRASETSAAPAVNRTINPSPPVALTLDRCRAMLPDLENEALAVRNKAAEAMLRLGRLAGPAAMQLRADAHSARTRDLLQAIAATLSSDQLTALEMLELFETEPSAKCSRPDSRPKDSWPGPLFAAHLRDLGLMRGVSLATTAEEFLRQLSSRSLAGRERFLVHDEAGVEHDLLQWVSRTAETPAWTGAPGAPGKPGAPSP